MAEILNGGRDKGALDGWIVVVAHGLTLIGKPQDGRRLGPVYEIKPQLQQSPQGLAFAHLVLPFLLLADVRSVAIPEGAILVECSDLGHEMQKTLSRAILGADEMVRAMRAQASGIALAPAGTKLPPIKERG